ncbi:AsmA-like C-terminal region-containing protein [Hyphomicrobium sp. CS1GBMeth3]|uniref:YhdP family protein n=1 Tax=Hyphomicrobium sp. CS1GBMeth3 TaxID=1892845 RepID=UPI0009FAD0CC|nr:AsmA-like C-terminal region-containing protein [Hyphomicrobium sp. CS1GBMeth3]
MTTHRSGRTRPPQAPPRNPGEVPYTSLHQRPVRTRSPAARRLFKAAHVLAFMLGPVLLLSLLAAGIVYVRLLHGPVSLKTFGERIEASINSELDGLVAAVEDAVLVLAENHTVELRLVNLRISETDGDLVASAPMAAVEINKRALLRLEARPERIFLIEPSLAVTYSEAQGFSLSIADAAADTTASEPVIVPPRPVPARPPGAAPAEAKPLSPAFHRIDVARILAETTERARRDGSGSSELREFGVRNAMLSVTYDGETSHIAVPEASVDLAHMKRRSVISGRATVESESGPWSLSFKTDQSARGKSLKVTATVHDFVPSTLAKISPGLGLLDMVDAPMNGDLALDLSDAGDLKTARLSVDLGRGFVRLPSLPDSPVLLENGRAAMVYNADARRLDIEPAVLDWGGSRISLKGAITSDPAQEAEPQWQFALESTEGTLSAEEFGVGAVPIDSFRAAGRIIPREGLAELSGLSLKAGGGEVNINGEVVTRGGSSSTRLDAALSPMPLATLKAMWPRAAAPTVRDWIGAQVERATLKSASMKLLSGQFVEAEGAAPSSSNPQTRISANMEIADLRMHPLPNSLPFEAPRATIRLENSSLEVTVPEATVISSETSRLPLNGMRVTIVDVTHEAPIAELAVKSQGSLPALIDALNNSQLHLAGQGTVPAEGISGKVDGELRISMPLVEGADVVKIQGKARITDIKSKRKEFDLQGGTIDIDASDIGVIAKGDLIVNGVVARLHMHRILDAAPEMQPPIRISATLDNSDRTQLGLDVNHLVQGAVPIEVTVTQKTDAPSIIHVRADLTNAELMFTGLAWRKPPGRGASLEFDIDPADPSRVQLTNFRLVGDSIAIDGWMTVNEKRDVSAFSFPNFSINVVTRLQVAGELDAKRVWKISAKGSTFDAKDLFRSLLALGNAPESEVQPLHPAAGVELTADIGTVLGHSDVSLRDYKLKVREGRDDIISLESQGILDGGQSLTVQIDSQGPRRLYAETADAGQALKLAGFYPNMQGGRLRLEVDLEARGATEKSGVLWIDDFRVLGDPVVSEVYSSAETGASDGSGSGNRRRKVEREVFEFTRMKAPFSIGHGQFVLDDSYIRGPLLGASIRGKADFGARRLSLGGTYVPLQGINSALCEIPLFGPIVSGFDCQGVFGITYAIQGQMAQPQVLVNPLSMFTPGILRTIMEMTSPNPQVQAPRTQQQRARASDPSGGSSQNVIDGWSSETTPTDSKKK